MSEAPPTRWIVDDEPSPRYPIYTRGNIGEVFPLPAGAEMIVTRLPAARSNVATRS